jgi:hypothetical protein
LLVQNVTPTVDVDIESPNQYGGQEEEMVLMDIVGGVLNQLAGNPWGSVRVHFSKILYLAFKNG